MNSLSNKTVVITGGGRGIGRAAARQFARHGARVVVASRTQAELKATEEQIKSEGGAVVTQVCDVAQSSDVKALFDVAEKVFSAPDVLINAAAIFFNRPAAAMTDDEWRRIFDVNVHGTFWACREAFRRMAGRGGSIVNIASLSGIRATEKFPGFAAYTASKHAVIGLTEALAVEGRPLGIRVNAIAPGAVDTAMLRQAGTGLKGASPESIAPTILFLADAMQSGPLTSSIVEIYCNEQ